MKNLVSIVCLLAVILVSGCTQDEMLRNRTSASGGRDFTTSFEQEESRTFVQNGNLLRWTAGDQISLFDANTLPLQYQFKGNTGANAGTFSMVSRPEGTGTPLSHNYAVYPYAEDVRVSQEGVLKVTLPAEQHYAYDSFGVGDNTMVAVTRNVDDLFLNFKNVGGYLKLQLYGDNITVKSITLTGNNGEKIAGKATLTVGYEQDPMVSIADDAIEGITLNCGTNGVRLGSEEYPTTFWIVVPPTTFEKGITVKVRDFQNGIFTQTTDKKLVIERNVVKPMATVKAVMEQENLLIGIPEEELNGWEEGFLIDNEIFFVTKEDSVRGTLAYFNKLNQNFEDGLLVEYDSNGIITQIHDHEYIHELNFTEDSLYVTSTPADTLSNISIKRKEIAFNYKEECYFEGISRASSTTMDKLAMYWFLHSTGKKLEISDKEVWQTIGQALIEEAIGESIEKGVLKVAGKAAGGIVGAALFAYDAIALNNEVKIYTYFGHARINIEGLGKGVAVNPKEFTVKCEKFNTLPSPSKYGMLKPFEYECGVLLDGKQHIGPISFKSGEIVNMGTYKIPELPEGGHSLTPYITCKYNGQTINGSIAKFFVGELELPEYSVKTKDIYYKKGEVKVTLEFNWTPINDSRIEYQGISFTKPNGEKFCLNLSDYQGGYAPHINTTSGEYSKDDFNYDYTNYIATSNLKIEYWVKYKDVFETHYFLLEDYEIVYDRKPSLVISNITVTDRGPYSGNVSGWDSYMSYTFDYTVDGGLFVTEIYEKYGENWTSSGSEYLLLKNFNDKTQYSSGGRINYSSKYTGASPLSYFAVLRNGKKHQFSQGMIFQGGSLSLNGSGGTRAITNMNSLGEQYPKPSITTNKK